MSIDYAPSSQESLVPECWYDISKEDYLKVVGDICGNMTSKVIQDLIRSSFWETTAISFSEKSVLTCAMLEYINTTKDEDLLAQVVFGADKQRARSTVEKAMIEVAIDEDQEDPSSSVFALELFVKSNRFNYFDLRRKFVFVSDYQTSETIIDVLSRCQPKTVEIFIQGFLEAVQNEQVEIDEAQVFFDYFASAPLTQKQLLDKERLVPLSWDDPLKPQIESLRAIEEKEVLQECLEDTLNKKPHPSPLAKKM